MDRDDEIKTRAHRIWEEEGRPEGLHEDHWRRAQEQLNAEDTAGEVGGMLGGRTAEPTPRVNPGSVAGSAGDAATPARKGEKDA